MCCQVQVSATSWSLVQRIPTDCGASLRVFNTHNCHWNLLSQCVLLIILFSTRLSYYYETNVSVFFLVKYYLFFIVPCSTEEDKAHAQCAEKVRRSKWVCCASLPPCRQQNPLRVVPSSFWSQHTARAVPARSVLDGLPATIPLFAGACLALDPSKGRNTNTKLNKINRVIFCYF